MEVLTALGDAENDLYSANFADYSGGGGTKVSSHFVHQNNSLEQEPGLFVLRRRYLKARHRIFEGPC